MSDLVWLTDAQMARLGPFFPRSHGRPRLDDRRVPIGIIFFNRNGLRWCDAPREYGPPKTLCNRWKRRSRKAAAVARCIEGPVGPMAPASMLQTHPATSVHLDPAAASLPKSRARRAPEPGPFGPAHPPVEAQIVPPGNSSCGGR